MPMDEVPVWLFVPMDKVWRAGIFAVTHSVFVIYFVIKRHLTCV